MKLVPIAAGDDIASLADTLAPGFGGDAGPARELLAQTLDLLTRDPRPQPWGSYLALDGGQDRPLRLQVRSERVRRG